MAGTNLLDDPQAVIDMLEAHDRFLAALQAMCEEQLGIKRPTLRVVDDED